MSGSMHVTVLMTANGNRKDYAISSISILHAVYCFEGDSRVEAEMEKQMDDRCVFRWSELMDK